MANEKYDRQLRVWGVNGQERLRTARVCCLKADNLACEAMKNLVLPGVGHFTMIDDVSVSPNDVNSSFFFKKTSIGQLRCKEALVSLADLNPDSQGSFIVQDPSFYFNNVENLQKLKPFKLILCSNLCETMFNQEFVLKFLLLNRITLISIRTFGFIGCIKRFAPDRYVIESKPNPKPMEDLHIYSAFSALKDFVKKSLGDANGDPSKLRELPHIVFLVDNIETFKRDQRHLMQQQQAKKMKVDESSDHSDSPDCSTFLLHLGFEKELERMMHFSNPKVETDLLPETMEKKALFKKQLSEYFSKSLVVDSDANDEATALAYTAYSVRENFHLKDLFDKISLTLEQPNISFWVLTEALKQFLESPFGSDLLPLTGSLPDMTSSTEIYKQLSALFIAKHETDFQVFSAIVDKILVDKEFDMVEIPREVRLMFVKHTSDIRFFPSCMDTEDTKVSELFFETLLSFDFMKSDDYGVQDIFLLCTPFLLRVLVKCFDETVPFTMELFESNFVARLSSLVEKSGENEINRNYFGLIGRNQQVRQTLMTEFFRGFDTDMQRPLQLNPICSFIGAAGAQEAVKELTAQFEPLTNCFIFNGLNSIVAEVNEKSGTF